MSAAAVTAARSAFKGTKHWPHTAPKLSVSCVVTFDSALRFLHCLSDLPFALFSLMEQLRI